MTAPVLDSDRAQAEFAAALSALERPAAFVRETDQIGAGRL